ncbi:baculoviral IAP repeat-containing protein 1f-like protein [Leptotrombidium deliense]|uniref:Baculoviral IAP repeat-containing protein 1f-like protein n=1 Tax=Leptotrombidium deliense TaxID=299467 RepID=A0A443RWG5_9ACAR|nr:baculoviral IAP repeat-containing protein 1f-like protein [Leptotrombidium deliense]
MAEAGFIHIGPADMVVCVYCHGKLTNWSSTDNPFIVHRSIFSNCKFVLGQCKTNVSKNNDPFPIRKDYCSVFYTESAVDLTNAEHLKIPHYSAGYQHCTQNEFIFVINGIQIDDKQISK